MQKHRFGLIVNVTLWLAWIFIGSGSVASATDDQHAFFEAKIRPLLANFCIECHGSKKASNGLRLDSRAGMVKGGESGPAMEPGKPDASLLIHAVRRNATDIKMPPDAPLSKQAIDDLNRWIEAGAVWPESIAGTIDSNKPHWAFQPLARIEPPDELTGWAIEPIDRFIAFQHQKLGLHPVQMASKTALLRRAYFDLIGLPPTPQQVEEFLANESPDAFARVVDKLLSSQRYGERWGRHWLDLVRYADTAGDNADYPIPQAYLYRDYVIDAFNSDLPYDRFLHEQLAGDILAKQKMAALESPTPDERSEYSRQVIATGFIAQSKRIGTRELEDMHLIIEDSLTTLGPALMGLSLRCARCHDHKFEPLTMEDYYSLYGFFASTQYPFAGAEEVRKQTKFAPLIPPAEAAGLHASHEAKVAQIRSQIQTVEMQATDDAEPQQHAQQIKSLREQLAALEKVDPLAEVPTAYAVSELKAMDVPVQKNGNPRSPSSQTVPRGVPKVLDAGGLEIPEGSSGRLELARWLTGKASFLTARVMVNRIWQNHFGKPLVPTPSDFGFRGTPPTHPELLDWLAAEFVDSGWSIKSLHRAIMLSKTYQLSTDSNSQNDEVDSGNQWYWRFDRRRLDAESLRDTILMLSDRLDFRRPGPHPFPEPSKWRYTAHHQFNDVCYPSDHRSVYLMVQRLHAHPYLSLFNGADPSLSTPSRDNSTVALQALYLLNNDFVHQKAEDFAMRLLRRSKINVDGAASEQASQSLIIEAFLHAYGRRPTARELSNGEKFLGDYSEVLSLEGVQENRREIEAWAGWTRAIMASNEFFYVD